MQKCVKSFCKKQAAAYCPGWKEKIEKIQKDDIIFLYKSGVGIIAYGKADGKLRKKEWEGVPDDEYYMQLEEFKILKMPMDAAKIKTTSNRGIMFNTTLFPIDEETRDKLIKEINKSHL